MFFFKSKPFLVVFLISISISLSLQTPVLQNYTDDLLRLAKSAEINAFIEKSENQCNNFYGKVCGNWKLTYPATYAEPKTSYLDHMKQFYISKCLDLLKSANDDRSYNKMLKDFFHSCTIEKNKVKQSLESVLNNVVNFKGGWPKISSVLWYKTEYDWLKVIADLRRRLDVEIFIGLNIVPVLDGRGVQRIEIGAPKFQQGGRNFYLDENYANQRSDYKQSIAQKLREHYTDMPDNWADEVASQVLDIEQKLSKGLDEKNLPKKNITREQTVAQMKTYDEYVDVKRYLTEIFNRTVSDLIYESPLNYMTNLVEVIKDTPKLIIANYTMWRVLDRLDFAGGQNQQDNDIWCINKVMKYFPKHMDDMFDQAYNAIQFGDILYPVFDEIRNTFRAELVNLNWMSTETRVRALEKLNEMKLKLLHYYNGKLENEVNELLSYISNDNYYNNMLIILQWQTKTELGNLYQKYELPKEKSTGLPYYVHTENEIQIPVVFMQPRVLWDPVYPTALKYGTVGVLLAQQMLLGFFEKGSEFDKRGDPNPWWDKETKENYHNRTDCFKKQYENYRFQDKLVNDTETLLKAIVDNGALKIAYDTYHNWFNNAKADVLGKERLPNLDYKPHQFFFLAYGQMFCADYHYSINSFTKLPERLHVNGPVANLEEFGKEFNCQENTKMNPKNKCILF